MLAPLHCSHNSFFNSTYLECLAHNRGLWITNEAKYTKTFVMWGAGPCKLYSNILQISSSQPFWAVLWATWRGSVVALTKSFVMWVAHLYPLHTSLPLTMYPFPYRVATAHPKTAVMIKICSRIYVTLQLTCQRSLLKLLCTWKYSMHGYTGATHITKVWDCPV